MRRDYDIFEKFPDGSMIWRACVRGQFEAKRKVQELIELSEHEFVVIGIQAEELPPVKPMRSNGRPLARTATHGVLQLGENSQAQPKHLSATHTSRR